MPLLSQQIEFWASEQEYPPSKGTLEHWAKLAREMEARLNSDPPEGNAPDEESGA
jgi:hypothetical protein